VIAILSYDPRPRYGSRYQLVFCGEASVGHHEDCVKAMRYERPEFIPASAGILPAAWIEHRDALDRIVGRHPIVLRDNKAGQRDYDAVAGRYARGEATDE
jgi:hypothetical protein